LCVIIAFDSDNKIILILSYNTRTERLAYVKICVASSKW